MSESPSRAAAAAPSPRTVLKRGPTRAVYDRAAVEAILDEALVAHVAFLRRGAGPDGVETEAPSLIPTAFVRWDDAVYLHGSTANRAWRAAVSGEVCLAATLLDGLVLARSAFHTSMNYRSVVVYGRGEGVGDPDLKREALRRTVEHVCPGRWRDVRPPSPEELARTLVVRLPLDEASAKVRTGDPVEEEGDLALGCWAGQLPLALTPAAPLADALLRPGIEAPAYVRGWRR